ncbi:alpha/beta hydrolase, partial [Streptococcus suis]
MAIYYDCADLMDVYAACNFSLMVIPGVQLGGYGTFYAVFVMDVVKPFIDQVERTLSDIVMTSMIGS